MKLSVAEIDTSVTVLGRKSALLKDEIDRGMRLMGVARADHLTPRPAEVALA